MKCPKCNGEIKLINASYPRTYECVKCKFTFLKPPAIFTEE